MINPVKATSEPEPQRPPNGDVYLYCHRCQHVISAKTTCCTWFQWQLVQLRRVQILLIAQQSTTAQLHEISILSLSAGI